LEYIAPGKGVGRDRGVNGRRAVGWGVNTRRGCADDRGVIFVT